MHTFIQSYRSTVSVPGRTLISAPCNCTQKTGRLPLRPLVSARNEENHQVQRVYPWRESRHFFFSWEVVWKRPGVKHEFFLSSLVKITSLWKVVERTSHLLRDTVWSLRFVLLDTQRDPNLIRSVGSKHYEMFATWNRILSSEGQVELEATVGNLTHWGRGHLNCLNAHSRGF
jgi:hypothetical protein